MSERTTPRDRARLQTMSDITRIGRDHLARDGAAALSLRAVARDLGVVSSAVYRYVASRDELITLLVVDAFTELADAVDAAIAAAAAASSPSTRLRVAVREMRAWAIGEPARWGLLYGTPVPGYAAPANRTTGPGTRVMLTLLHLVAAARDAGALRDPEPVRLTRVLRSDLRAVAGEAEVRLPEPVVAVALLWWAGVVGVISSEVFGQLGDDTITDRDTLFDHHLTRLDHLLGL